MSGLRFLLCARVIDRRAELGEEIPYDVERMRLILGLTEMAQAFLKILMALRVPRSLDAMTGWLGRASRLTARFKQLG